MTVRTQFTMSAKKMLFIAFLGTFCLAAAVTAEGELQILHSTKSLQFHGHERLSQDTLKEVLSACLGFTIEKSYDWKGLRILDPFEYSDAVVVMVVDGVRSVFNGHTHNPSYPLDITEHEEDTWQSLRSRIEARFPNKVQNNSVHRINLKKIVNGETSPLLEGVQIDEKIQSYSSLDPVNYPEDAELLKQVELVRALAAKVKTEGIPQDGLPDLYWIVLPGLRAVSQKHGAHSRSTLEAQKLVTEAAKELSHAFNKAYGGRVVFAVVSKDSSPARRARSLDQETTVEIGQSHQTRSLLQEGPVSAPTLSEPSAYSADYPVIFNIILWFSVVLVFALIAISVAIADMDPGRDSIIYRMTSTRMKKDN